jgi:hypothetical protein
MRRPRHAIFNLDHARFTIMITNIETRSLEISMPTFATNSDPRLSFTIKTTLAFETNLHSLDNRISNPTTLVLIQIFDRPLSLLYSLAQDSRLNTSPTFTLCTPAFTPYKDNCDRSLARSLQAHLQRPLFLLVVHIPFFFCTYIRFFAVFYAFYNGLSLLLVVYDYHFGFALSLARSLLSYF